MTLTRNYTRWLRQQLVLNTGLLLILLIVSGCVGDSPQASGEYCHFYQPVYDVDHPDVLYHNALWEEFCA